MFLFIHRIKGNKCKNSFFLIKQGFFIIVLFFTNAHKENRAIREDYPVFFLFHIVKCIYQISP